MKKSKLLVGRLSGLTLTGAAVLMAAPQSAYGYDTGAPCDSGACDAQAVAVDAGRTDGERALPALFPGQTWGIIGRNTLGGPNAVLRDGPYGRTTATFAATQAPPYGQGSLGIIVGSGADKIAFGNETIFAGDRLSAIRTLRYWIFAGVDSLTGVSVPNITIEADPNVGTADYTSLVYLPDTSTSPSAPATRVSNAWQRYDAAATGSRWYATGATGTTIGCTQATPCSFTDLKTRLPNAVISLSLGISKGRDNPFVGAVDGLRVNNTVYDFEFSGVRTRLER
ncbi:hypothetical protein ITP53_00715 [Nonomuraea sp. K274]|uniref:Uncharacterized protein n=1 Tax=Nonomuraea cypriaca TaxID=1187855 RepID=A0A931A169_9ACTN|nr:hypothetical protein [Nonomuraea cypriaca]MBF8184291.1 hypothetical protein [Nonomuraea cypriaca]